MAKKTFIIDYDDTLTWNQHDYSYPQIEMILSCYNKFRKKIPKDHSYPQIKQAKYLIDNIQHNAPDVQTIINLQTTNESFELHNFLEFEFAKSFIKTYENICAKALIKTDLSYLKKMFELGEEAWRVYGERTDTYIQETFAKKIINLEVNIDKEHVKTMGFCMERFPTSFVKTYESLCKEFGFEIKEKEQQKYYDMGMKAFSYKRYKEKGFVKGAEEILDFLKKDGNKLILYTKGDKRVQEKKLEAIKIYKNGEIIRWFDEVHIVDLKSKKQIEELIGSENKNNVYKIGNSIRSDVKPALEAGIKVIYIPYETWAYEREHNGLSDEERKRVIEIPKIIDIKKIYQDL
ncbi:MAG: hypothetical protein KKC26_00770 [Nanoarchaeota archaeon]|nr:hypothetical protein [Nanoarchaeota archaeon]